MIRTGLLRLALMLRTAWRARSRLANGPSVCAALGASRVPLQLSLPLGATKNSAALAKLPRIAVGDCARTTERTERKASASRITAIAIRAIPRGGRFI